MATAVAPSLSADSNSSFTASDHIRTQVDAAVSQFYTKMNTVQIDLHNYEKIPNSSKTDKAEAAKKVQASWDEAALIVQNLRELRDTLQNKESEAVYNYQMNDGVWKNGQALQDVDQHLLDRQMRLDSARQLSLQSEQQQRRHVKIKWLYVILFIVLLGAATYMYMWAVGNEIGLHNAESVDEALETPPADTTSPNIMESIGDTFGMSDKTDSPPESSPQTDETVENNTENADNFFESNTNETPYDDDSSSESSSESSSDSSSSSSSSQRRDSIF